MKISIITINYNNASGLLKTITSVQSQTYSNYEYIIIDGGSSDESVQYIKQNLYKVSYWVSEPDRGIYHAMNKGVSKATGDYCLFLNSGDVLSHRDVLRNIAEECYGQDFVIGRVRYLNTGLLNERQNDLTLKFFFMKSIPHPSTFIKRTIFNEFQYDESLKIVSDWKLFIEAIILRNASYKHSDVLVADFDPTGISSNNKELVESERFKVLNSILPPRMYEDYLSFLSGEGYKMGYYDHFYIKLRSYKYAKYIYTISIIIMKIAALIMPGASFVKNFPLVLPKEEIY